MTTSSGHTVWQQSTRSDLHHSELTLGDSALVLMVLGNLDIDPDMRFETFKQRLEWGERAEAVTPWSVFPPGDKDPMGIGRTRAESWNECLDRIKGDRPRYAT